MQVPQQTGLLFSSPATPFPNALTPLSPSPLASSLSSSTTQISIDNFTQPLEEVKTTLDEDSIAIAEEGSLTVLSDAVASESDTIFLSSASQTFTEADPQDLVKATGIGQGQIVSQVIGEFQIEANENFSFDFASLLSLESFLESPDTDSSRTISSISLLLIDTFNHNLIYEFSVFSSINLSNDAQEILVQAVETGSSAINNFQSQFLFDGIRNRLDLAFEGSFQQFFEDDTQLTLATLTQSQSCIQAPQLPSSCPAFIGLNSDKSFDDGNETDDELFGNDGKKMLAGGDTRNDELLGGSSFGTMKDFEKGFDQIELPDSLTYGNDTATEFCFDKIPLFHGEDILADLQGNNANLMSAPARLLV